MSSATSDVLAILRGMLDAAGERNEEEQAPLIVRVRRTVRRYLSTPDNVEA
ncbi:hypothetical protein SKA58_01155 [Sphingomonas sp. SKA58]|nr:hypothetical protein SKA58_01155 [Sphingomonas sp. SKA58]|tara:strand:+ start:3128 stop:3280 length:153 start_codon:yes stop_codon:yes gene_type:complete